MAAGAWSVTGTSSANTAQTLTKAAPDVGLHFIQAYDAVTTAAAAGADITIILKDGTTAIHTSVIPAGSPRGTRAGWDFGKKPIPCANATAVNLVVLAGGASVVTIANIVGEERIN